MWTGVENMPKSGDNKFCFVIIKKRKIENFHAPNVPETLNKNLIGFG